MIVLNEDELLEPWEHDPLPTVYDDDDYPVEDPHPCPADADRAARAWQADRLRRGEP